jgi:hypothetical protein
MNWLKDARSLTLSATAMLFALSGGVTPAVDAAEPDDQHPSSPRRCSLVTA